MADIATIAVTKTIAAPTAAADANATGSVDSMFAVLLQQLTQVVSPSAPSAPANDAGQPTPQNDNGEADAQSIQGTSPISSMFPVPSNLTSLTAMPQSGETVAQSIQGETPVVSASSVPSNLMNTAAPSQSGETVAQSIQRNTPVASASSVPSNLMNTAAPSQSDEADAQISQDQTQIDSGSLAAAMPANSTALLQSGEVKLPSAPGPAKVKPSAKDEQDEPAATQPPPVDPQPAAQAAQIAAPMPVVPSAPLQLPQAAQGTEEEVGSVAGATASSTAGTKPASDSNGGKLVAASNDAAPAQAKMESTDAGKTISDGKQTDGRHNSATDGTAGLKTATRQDSPNNDTAGQSDAGQQTPPPSNSQPSAQTAPSAPTAPDASPSAVQAPAAAVNVANVDMRVQVSSPHHDSGTSATVDTLGVAIAAKSADGVKHFDIRMDPPELGRIEVHLSLGDDGKAQASLVVDKPQTLELLQRDAGSLNRTLSDAGLDLSNNGLNFSLRGQDRQNDGGSVVKGRSRSLSVKAVVNADTISNSGSIVSLAPGSGRVDIRV